MATGRGEVAAAPYSPPTRCPARPAAQSLYGVQQQFTWGQTAGLAGGMAFKLNWTVFDGGARRKRPAQAEANVHEAEAQTHGSREQIANELWAPHPHLNTALRQPQATTALVEAPYRASHG